MDTLAGLASSPEQLTREEDIETAKSFGLLRARGSWLEWARWAREAGEGPAFDLAAFQSLRGVVQFLDYSEKTVFMNDRSRMDAYLQCEQPPPIAKTYPNAPRLLLHHPSLGEPFDRAGKLGVLLFWSFGRLRQATFLDVLTMQFKPVPSLGARHPLEAYVCVAEGACIPEGTYHYDPIAHALEQLDTRADVPFEAGQVLLTVSVIFERFQWRYRDKWIYKDLFHEIGHVQGNLHLVADEYSLKLEPRDDLHLMQDSERLVEEPYASFLVLGLQGDLGE
ncbi:SagB/ThcOx family dehydrogenase [Cystobacter fuscus]|uniref:SagB/ThcOx family dehydrogenase n=1 Tax=Cystobacter fuscus TaxID=43 RepID=UPI0002AE08FE|nr:SagB/ThcOx family dehydrogenase [Cystobacter fuscus]